MSPTCSRPRPVLGSRPHHPRRSRRGSRRLPGGGRLRGDRRLAAAESVLRLALAAGALLLLAGCAGLLKALQEAAQRPSARMSAVHLEELALDGVTLLFEVEVHNPSASDLVLTDVTYSLSSSSSAGAFLRGRSHLGGTLAPGDTHSLSIPADVDFLALLDAVSGLRPGAVLPYTARLVFTLQGSGLQPVDLAVSAQGQIPVPEVPSVSLAAVVWEELSLDHAQGWLVLDVRNRNRFPLDLRHMSWSLALEGRAVAQGRSPVAASFFAGDRVDLEVPFELSPMGLGLAVYRILSGSVAGYSLQGDLDAATPFGILDLPFSAFGHTVLERGGLRGALGEGAAGLD